MTTTITIPTGFSYVAAALLSTVFLLGSQIVVVSTHRRRAGIAYPQLYADKAEAAASPAALKFNCAQRVHQNTLEYLPGLYVMTLILGLKQPTLAASALGMWVLGRVAYGVGYVTGDPERRNNIVTVLFATPSILTLLGGATYSVYQLVTEGA
ncbi:membrane-associated proteins in eicosanoid and glutathione metabolism [Mycena rosella]|uniref:Membrane-associated proteins in eicosanoid and glutathione metabolism n=1 Tax=Mycena rosella TaxID=1033263 RepID=A0AAD7DY34_MYCRO|nr:membrane-associated proteins in eicosanoid and glutathione metabolism [Mycena rosella]